MGIYQCLLKDLNILTFHCVQFHHHWFSRQKKSNTITQRSRNNNHKWHKVIHAWMRKNTVLFCCQKSFFKNGPSLMSIFCCLYHATKYQNKKNQKKQKSISVLCRIILGWHHQTSSFPCSSVHCFNNVYHLLLVFHCPVDLVVVTGAQINHDVFVPEKHTTHCNGSQIQLRICNNNNSTSLAAVLFISC